MADSQLRLGFHYHIPAALGTRGQILTPGYQGRFIDALAERCRYMTLFLHECRPIETGMDYSLQADNVTWVSLGPAGSVPSRMRRSRQIRTLVRPHRRAMDALLVRGPSPLLPVVAAAARGVATALLLVGDQLAGVDDLPQPRWRKELIRLFWIWNARAQDRIARNSLVFVNSNVLFEAYRRRVANVLLTRTTTLTGADFSVREDTCEARPVRLLYTGRYSHEKGLLDMVAALADLVDGGEDVVLDLVGWAEPGSTVLADVRAEAERLGVANRVRNHGFKAVGPELFACYFAADIYVIASRSSEGFPRTLWEAMANSMPVVATRVGSIPHYLNDGQQAVLVEPRQPAQLANALRGLILSPDLRRRLISEGRALTLENTVERRAEEMVHAIESFVRARSPSPPPPLFDDRAPVPNAASSRSRE